VSTICLPVEQTLSRGVKGVGREGGLAGGYEGPSRRISPSLDRAVSRGDNRFFAVKWRERAAILDPSTHIAAYYQ
jgi:hypothetical protein